MKEVRAMRLKIQAFARCVRRYKNAQRILGRVGVESTLNFLPVDATREAIDYLDTLVRPLRTFNCLFEDCLEVAFCALSILRKNKNAAVVPRWRLARQLASKWRQIRAEIASDPVDQEPSFSVRQMACFLGDF